MTDPKQMLRCPVCGAKVEPPRAAWFGAGRWETRCPDGHPVVVEHRAEPDKPEERAGELE